MREAPAEGSAGGSDPVLSTDRLTSIARSPLWKEAIAALPAPEVPPPARRRRPRAT